MMFLLIKKIGRHWCTRNKIYFNIFIFFFIENLQDNNILLLSYYNIDTVSKITSQCCAIRVLPLVKL